MDCVSWFNFMSRTCDFGCGFLVFGCFKQLFNLICLFLFINLGLNVFQFGFHYKGFFRNLCDFTENSGNLMKNGSFFLEMVKKSEPKLKKSKSVSNRSFGDESVDLDNGDSCNVDDVFNVLSLRNMVKRERRRANAAYAELDKERVAASTAADEAMAMILRLQNEKSVIEMEANQYRRLVEEKQIHDQEVIQSLRWIVMKHESERSYLEEQLKFYQRRLKNLSKGDDMDMWEENGDCTSVFNSSTVEASPYDGLISSLDFDLSTL